MAKPTIPSPDDYNTDNEILPPSAAQDAPPTEEGYDTDDTDTYISRKASAAAIFISKLLDLEPEELAKNLMENDNLQFLSSLDDAELLKRVFDIVKEQQKKFSSQHPDFPGVKELIRHDNFHLLCYPNPSRNFLKAIFHELKETGELQEAMHKTSFFALESFYRIADKEDLILIKTILADFADAEQEAYILNHLSLTSILERGGDEAFKWWINNASKLGCLDELMRKNLPYFDMKAKEDPEFVTKLIPAFMELKQQAAICLRYSNE